MTNGKPLLGRCWIDPKKKPHYGYVRVTQDGVTRQGHRAAYEVLVGAIPNGLQLDHLCRNRACYNPRHLEPVTCRINLLRGDTNTARNAAVTECPQGHSYDRGNTGVKVGPRGTFSRVCRACDRARHRRLWHKRNPESRVYHEVDNDTREEW